MFWYNAKNDRRSQRGSTLSQRLDLDLKILSGYLKNQA